MVILIESVHDPVRYTEYIAAVKAIVEQHGGEYIARSNKITAFCGTIKPERSIVIGFDSLAQAESCLILPNTGLSSTCEKTARYPVFFREKD